MLPLEVRLAVLEFHGGELAPQDLHKEVAAPARRLQEAGINAFRLVLHQVEHSLDHPRRGEHLPVVGDALFGFDVVQGRCISADASLWSLRANSVR